MLTDGRLVTFDQGHSMTLTSRIHTVGDCMHNGNRKMHFFSLFSIQKPKAQNLTLP